MRHSAPPILIVLLLGVLTILTPGNLHAQAAAATPEATPAAKTLFLIRGPDGIITPIHAVTFQEQGAALLLVNDKGGRAMVQARAVVGQLPWFTVEEVEGGAADPEQLAAKYEVFASRFPSLRGYLTAEANRFHAIQKARDTAAAAEKAAAEARIQAVTATSYDPAAEYTVESLESLLQAADAVRSEDPTSADRIDEWAAPFRDHLAKLKAGSRYLDGAWVTKEEMARRIRNEREAAFLKTLDSPRIAALSLPEDAVRGVVRKATLAAGVAMLIGIALIVVFRRRIELRAMGVALLVGGPAAVAVLYFLATRDPSRLPATSATADLHPILAALEEAAAVDPDTVATEHSITEAGLNTFLARHIAIDRADGASWAVTRQALAVRLLPNGASIFEQVRSVGHPWIVRYDLAFRAVAGSPSIAVTGVRIGGLTCPPGLAQQLWKSLEEQLSTTLATLHVTGQFVVQDSGDGWIKIGPPSAPPTAAQPTEPGAALTATPAGSPAISSPSPEVSPDVSPAATATPEATTTSAGNPPDQSPTPARTEESSATPTP